MEWNIKLSPRTLTALIVVFVLYASFSVIGHHLSQEGFFHDGYLYAAMGANVLRNHQVFPMTPSSFHFPNSAIHPPLTFLLEVIFFAIFGVNTLAARFSGVFFSVLSVVSVVVLLLKEKKVSWAMNTALALLLTIPFLRKSRFPNTDIILTTLYTVGLICVYYMGRYRDEKNQRGFYRYLVYYSFCTGLALLTKGPNGIIFYIFLFSYFFYKKSLRSFFYKPAIIYLTLPIFLFSLWPIVLYKVNSFEQFTEYVKHQVIGTALKGRGKETWDLGVYFHFLFFYCMPWGIVALFNLYKNLSSKTWEKGEKDLYYLFFLATASVLIPFSFVKFKYSHYIMPIYPAFAAFNGYFLTQIFSKVQSRVNGIFFFAVLLANFLFGLGFLGDGKKRGREKELYYLTNYLQNTQKSVENIINLNEVYPYFNLINYVSFYHPQIHVYTKDPIQAKILFSTWREEEKLSSILLGREEEMTSFKKEFPQYAFLPIYAPANSSFQIYLVMNKNSL